MFDRFRSKPSRAPLQEVAIGGGNLIVELPAYYAVETDENKDVVAYDPNAEDGVLRFTVYYFTGEQARGAERLVVYVRKFAGDERKKLQRHESKVYFTDQESTVEEDGSRSVMRFWTVGFEDTAVLISCWVSKAGEKSAAAQLAIQSAERAVQSLRNAPFHTYDAPEGAKQEIFPLRPEDDEQLRAWRESAHRLVARVLGRPRLMGTERDLEVIQELLDNSALGAYDEDSLRGLGVIFGDHLARKMDLRWATVVDAWGPMPGLTYADLSLVLYPGDMILKRVERSESFSVIELFNSLTELVRKEIESGEVKGSSTGAHGADQSAARNRAPRNAGAGR